MKDDDVRLNDELQQAIDATRRRHQADMLAILEGRPLEGADDDDDDPTEALREEIVRLERRFLEETKAHDKTRHRLHCREVELERIRSNMYKQRVEETQEKEGSPGHYPTGGGFVNDFDPLATGARIMATKLADDLDKSIPGPAYLNGLSLCSRACGSFSPCEKLDIVDGAGWCEVLKPCAERFSNGCRTELGALCLPAMLPSYAWTPSAKEKEGE